MAPRILWNAQETAVLVDYCARVNSGNITRRCAVELASKELRAYALHLGRNIDDIYRNRNGIAMQMSKIEDLFAGRETRLSKAPKVFETVVDLYLHDKAAFDRLLKEAREEGTIRLDEASERDQAACQSAQGRHGSAPKLEQDLSPYTHVLQTCFPKGYRLKSTLDLKRFIRSYNELHGSQLDANDEDIRNETRQRILKAGVRHEDYVFAVDCLADADTKEQLLAYIERGFAAGKRVLYYKAIFEAFNEKFLDQRVYDEDMLRTYLAHVCANRYEFAQDFMSQRRGVCADPKEEIRDILVSRGAPMKTKAICKALSHLPSDRVGGMLRSEQEFIYNGGEEYFHVSLIDFSADELEDISKIIQRTIHESRFISGNELIRDIGRKRPAMLERFPQVSQLGLRDSVAYCLADRFSFQGNIISPLDAPLSTSDVFAEFAKTHRSFTIDELNVLKTEMNTTIPFEPIYENSLRVSQKQFVSKERAAFDVAGTDEAIGGFCTGAYVPLAGVTSFSQFPDAGFSWNIYLLEHFVAAYSAEYRLLHKGFHVDGCAGAIVRRGAGIGSYHELITDVLAHSGIELNKDSALQYLYEMGYVARRRFSGLDQILIKARAQKG